MARLLRAVHADAGRPLICVAAASRTLRITAGSVRAETDFVLRASHLRMADASSGQSARRFVLNPHCRSAVRIALSSGLPLLVPIIAGMTVTSAHAMLARRFAAECFHFMST